MTPVAYVHFAGLVGARPPPQPWICATSTAASTHRDPAPRETAHPPIVVATRETAETSGLSLDPKWRMLDYRNTVIEYFSRNIKTNNIQ